MPNLVELIKKIAIQVVEDSKPAGVVYGTVLSTNPLRITIDQKLTLESTHISLTSNVKDYNVDITLDGIRRNYTVHNGLKNGEKVILLREQGGQAYIVIDRVVT